MGQPQNNGTATLIYGKNLQQFAGQPQKKIVKTSINQYLNLEKAYTALNLQCKLV